MLSPEEATYAIIFKPKDNRPVANRRKAGGAWRFSQCAEGRRPRLFHKGPFLQSELAIQKRLSSRLEYSILRMS